MNYLGGYLLFPSTQTYADLVQVTLQAMELTPADVKVLLPRKGFAFPPSTNLPTEEALGALVQTGGGLNATIVGRPELYWFEPAAGPYSLPDLWEDGEAWLEPVKGLYPVVNIWVADVALRNEAPYTPIEQFVERWLRLCERGHVIFGYFSPFEFKTERDFLDERVFPHLREGNLPELLKDSDSSWLVYLGPELAKRWRQEHVRWPRSQSNSEPFLSYELSSGAQFIRTSEGIFVEKGQAITSDANNNQRTLPTMIQQPKRWNIFARELEDILTAHNVQIGRLSDLIDIHREKTRRLRQSLLKPKSFPVLNREEMDLLIQTFDLSEGEQVRLRAALLATAIERMLMDRVDQDSALQASEQIQIIIRDTLLVQLEQASRVGSVRDGDSDSVEKGVEGDITWELVGRLV